jgi:hypothetical protein
MEGKTFVQALRTLADRAGLSWYSWSAFEGRNKWMKGRLLVKIFRWDVKEYYDLLTGVFRGFRRLRKEFKSIEEAETFIGLYHELPKIEWKMEILRSGSDELKLGLLREDPLWQSISLIWPKNWRR